MLHGLGDYSCNCRCVQMRENVLPAARELRRRCGHCVGGYGCFTSLAPGSSQRETWTSLEEKKKTLQNRPMITNGGAISLGEGVMATDCSFHLDPRFARGTQMGYT